MADRFSPITSIPKQSSKAVSVGFSDHIARLAEPKRNMFMSQDDPSKKGVKKSAMKYKASRRIQSLAKPKYVNPKKVDKIPVDPLTQSITSVSPSALNYRPTRRILELAQPK